MIVIVRCIAQDTIVNCPNEEKRAVDSLDLKKAVVVRSSFPVRTFRSSSIETPTLVIASDSANNLQKFSARVKHSIDDVDGALVVEVDKNKR